jgi:hypothetical protein
LWGEIIINKSCKYGKQMFPLLFKEGWIRPQFSLIALSAGGDGVVKVK